MTHEEFSRVYSIETSDKTLKTPFFFPAISTTKTDLPGLEYLSLVRQVGYPGFLISAYDIHQTKGKEMKSLLNVLAKCAESRTTILLDSGNYEAYWYRDKTWELDRLGSVLKQISVDLCFSFDVFWNGSKKVEKHIKDTVTSVARTAAMQKTGLTIPIIHSSVNELPKILKKIMNIMDPEIIALPERELGSSILERCQTIVTVRKILDKTKEGVPIHLLGTGNPLSILMYTLCGADLYDALEWCTTVIDPKTGLLLDFSQRDLIKCDCSACKMKGVPYEFQTMAHNLIFYRDFLDDIRRALKERKVGQILRKYLSNQAVSKINKLVRLREI